MVHGDSNGTMASRLLCRHADLEPFLIEDVKPTGLIIGSGAFAKVEAVELRGVTCAAKKIHEILQDRSEISDEELEKVSEQFAAECRLMSSLRHPHIVQFIGVCYLPGSRLPALIMERLVASLHDVLEPEPEPKSSGEKGAKSPPPYIPLGLKCSIVHDVARGLDFLHHLPQPVVHRDLSAKNVLLTAGMEAKIADLGVARRVLPRLEKVATLMTQAPGTAAYMPQEAVETMFTKEGVEKAKYNTTIDIFSLGVVTLFALCQTFPYPLLGPSYMDEKGLLKARSEVERRERYLQKVYRELGKTHPLVQMVEQCLHYDSTRRPTLSQILAYLDRAQSQIADRNWDKNKLELLQLLQRMAKPPSEQREPESGQEKNPSEQKGLQEMEVHVQYRSDARYKPNAFAFSCKRVCLLVINMYLPQCTIAFAM